MVVKKLITQSIYARKFSFLYRTLLTILIYGLRHKKHRVLLTATFKKNEVGKKFFLIFYFVFLLVFGITNHNFTAIVENGMSQISFGCGWLIVIVTKSVNTIS